MRALLAPAETLYGAVIATRGRLYDWGIFRATEFPVPVLSIGNLSVGGTGKTPIAAWFAHKFSEKGAAPAIVLRGYGGDEIIVHRRRRRVDGEASTASRRTVARAPSGRSPGDARDHHSKDSGQIRGGGREARTRQRRFSRPGRNRAHRTGRIEKYCNRSDSSSPHAAGSGPHRDRRDRATRHFFPAAHRAGRSRSAFQLR